MCPPCANHSTAGLTVWAALSRLAHGWDPAFCFPENVMEMIIINLETKSSHRRFLDPCTAKLPRSCTLPSPSPRPKPKRLPGIRDRLRLPQFLSISSPIAACILTQPPHEARIAGTAYAPPATVRPMLRKRAGVSMSKGALRTGLGAALSMPTCLAM